MSPCKICLFPIITDVGAIFSGATIVRWLVDSVAGVNTEERAVTLGQLLLTQGALVHSEGSMYATHTRTQTLLACRMNFTHTHNTRTKYTKCFAWEKPIDRVEELCTLCDLFCKLANIVGCHNN